MRILWFSGAVPWAKTGYGQQTALIAPRLAKLGHDVAVYASAGLAAAPIRWEGLTILPNVDDDPQGLEILEGHARAWQADLIIMLLDAWPRDPTMLAEVARSFPLAYWLPVDSYSTDYPTGWHPLGPLYEEHLKLTGGRIIPMTAHAEKLCRMSGLDTLPHIPHGIDTSIFTPVDNPDHKRQIRRAKHVPEDAFIVGINANNGDKNRKSYGEAFQMFARFHVKHPRSALMVHARESTRNGLQLGPLGAWCGAEPYFTDQYAYRAGVIEAADMADWYRCLDVLLHVSHGEGFGIAAVEAQACGVQVVTTDAEPMTSLVVPGPRVATQPWWNYLHQSAWHMPLIESGVRCLERAAVPDVSGSRARKCREFALQFDVEALMPRWEEALCELGRRAGTS